MAGGRDVSGDDKAHELSTSRAILALWAAFLAAPVAWLLQMQLNYALVPWACAHHASVAFVLVALLALAVAAGGGLSAWRTWRRVGAEESTEAGGSVGRTRFLALTGVMTSAMFSLVILAQGLAAVFLSPCQL